MSNEITVIPNDYVVLSESENDALWKVVEEAGENSHGYFSFWRKIKKGNTEFRRQTPLAYPDYECFIYHKIEKEWISIKLDEPGPWWSNARDAISEHVKNKVKKKEEREEKLKRAEK